MIARDVVSWERRRLAGILCAFEALFFREVLSNPGVFRTRSLVALALRRHGVGLPVISFYLRHGEQSKMRHKKQGFVSTGHGMKHQTKPPFERSGPRRIQSFLPRFLYVTR